MAKLIMGLVCILAGLLSIVKADDMPLLNVVGAVYFADERDCAMLLNLTDFQGVCYYTYVNSQGVIDALERYGKANALVVSEPLKIYDAKFLAVGSTHLIVRKSDMVDMYIVLIEVSDMSDGG